MNLRMVMTVIYDYANYLRADIKEEDLKSKNEYAELDRVQRSNRGIYKSDTGETYDTTCLW